MINQKEKIAAVLIALVAGVCTFISFNMFGKSNVKTSSDIVVYYCGEEITEVKGQKIDINKDMTFTLGDEDIGYNIIEIKDKRVRIIEADCPEQICVKHGYLNNDIDNDMIICAPHRITIKYEK